MAAIHISNLLKTYGEAFALEIDRLSIGQGTLAGLVGNNGAGKTTLLRLLLDLIKGSGGSVTLGGIDTNRSDQWKMFTGSYLDEGFLIDFLTAEEYLEFTGNLYGMDSRAVGEQTQFFSRFLGDEVLGQKKYIRDLSAGNKQKVGIVAAMMVRPRLLILDEPFNYLDPSSQILMRRMLQEDNAARGTTMLISSHNLNHLAGICQRILLLEKGKMLRDLSLPQDGIAEVEKYFSLQAE